MLKRSWWHHRHTAAGREGFAPSSATLLHVEPALAAPALAALALAAPGLAAPVLAASALWAEENFSAIVCRMMGRGGYLCTALGEFYMLC